MIFIVVSLILSLDQFSKLIVSKNLSLSQSLPVIKGIFHLSLVHNRGAAFGIFKNQLPLFVFTSCLAITLICFNLKRGGKRSYNIALSLILGGALGNLIDRLSLGYVIDFLDFRVWPVFNLADSAITVGAVLLGYSILTTKDRCINKG